MKEYEALHESTEKAGIQVDAYGIKANVQPSDTGETRPKTWKEVGQRVHDYLKSLCLNLFGLANDSIEGSRRLIRGLTRIPNSLANRIERAHDQADRQEDRLQTAVETAQTTAPLRYIASENLEVKLLELQAQGIPVVLRELPDGKWAIILVRREHHDLTDELIQPLLLPSPESSAQFPESQTSISNIGLSRRVRNVLLDQGIGTIGELVQFSQEELLQMRNIGEKSLTEVLACLKARGFSLRNTT